MNSTIPLPHSPTRPRAREERGQRILFDPVEFEKGEGVAVETADRGEGVGGFQAVGEEVCLVGEGAGFVPGVRDAGDVHPFVQELRVGHVCRVYLRVLGGERRDR